MIEWQNFLFCNQCCFLSKVKSQLNGVMYHKKGMNVESQHKKKLSFHIYFCCSNLIFIMWCRRDGTETRRTENLVMYKTNGKFFSCNNFQSLMNYFAILNIYFTWWPITNSFKHFQYWYHRKKWKLKIFPIGPCTKQMAFFGYQYLFPFF